MSKLLVVDDEEAICWCVQQVAQKMGHDARTVSTAEEAIELAKTEAFDAVVLDVRLPGMDGLSAISRLREHLGSAPIVVMTAYGDLETAVEAVRQGAFEYVLKPFDADKARRFLSHALNQSAPVKEFPSQPSAAGFVGETAEMQAAYTRIALAAASDASVLLTGESGTGKELAARAIHKYGDRAKGPFVAANIAALSTSLAESELFGHAKGAFTGAEQARRGLLLNADGGTLFLDEVADIPLPTQTKLLRAIEDGEVFPVGSDRTHHTDLRIVSATHRDLPTLVREGKFRHDLFYRISTFEIQLPPLRSRREDIPRLAAHFAQEFSQEKPFGLARLSDEALADLLSREWRGNVRELRNVIEHAVVMARGGDVLPEHLPAPNEFEPASDGDLTLESTIHELLRRWTQDRLKRAGEVDDLYEQLLTMIEPTVLATVVAAHGGQVAAAARTLGLHRTTLRKKLDQADASSLGDDA